MQPEEIIDLLVRARDICDDMVQHVSPKYSWNLEESSNRICAVINLIEKDCNNDHGKATEGEEEAG